MSIATSGTTFLCQTFNYDATGVEVRDTYPACALRGDKSWNATNYTAALDYQFTDATMAYALFSRGYKSGGFSLRSHRPSIFSYDPEFMKNYEVGVKSDWKLFDRPIRTNLSVFRMDYSDQQLQSTVAGSFPVQTFVDNIGKSRITGAEFKNVVQACRQHRAIRFRVRHRCRLSRVEQQHWGGRRRELWCHRPL